MRPVALFCVFLVLFSGVPSPAFAEGTESPHAPSAWTFIRAFMEKIVNAPPEKGFFERVLDFLREVGFFSRRQEARELLPGKEFLHA